MTFGTKVVCLGQEVVCAVNSSSFFCGRDLLFCEDQRVQQIYTQKKVPSQQQINSPWSFVGFSYSTASV